MTRKKAAAKAAPRGKTASRKKAGEPSGMEGSNSRAASQHPGDAEVFVEFRPVNAHRHQFEVRAHGGTGVPQVWLSGRGQFLTHDRSLIGLTMRDLAARREPPGGPVPRTEATGLRRVVPNPNIPL
jgi:hypothetical protein